jgi:hypothetical protein
VAPERRGGAQRRTLRRRREAARLASLPSLWRPYQLDRRLRTHRGFRRWWRRLERRGTYRPGMWITLRRARLRVFTHIGVTFAGRKIPPRQMDRLVNCILTEVL